jgi:hypothetical protein
MMILCLILHKKDNISNIAADILKISYILRAQPCILDLEQLTSTVNKMRSKNIKLNIKYQIKNNIYSQYSYFPVAVQCTGVCTCTCTPAN